MATATGPTVLLEVKRLIPAHQSTSTTNISTRRKFEKKQRWTSIKKGCINLLHIIGLPADLMDKHLNKGNTPKTKDIQYLHFSYNMDQIYLYLIHIIFVNLIGQ